MQQIVLGDVIKLPNRKYALLRPIQGAIVARTGLIAPGMVIGVVALVGTAATGLAIKSS